MGDGKHWITVIQGSHGVIDLNFVYTLSLLVTVYTLSLLVYLFIPSLELLFILGG